MNEHSLVIEIMTVIELTNVQSKVAVCTCVHQLISEITYFMTSATTVESQLYIELCKGMSYIKSFENKSYLHKFSRI